MTLPDPTNPASSIREVAERMCADLNGYDGAHPKDELHETEVQQAMILIEALVVMRSRQQGYKDCWKDSGWRGCLFDLRKKAERAWNEFWFGGADKNEYTSKGDSAIDVINYACFFLRQWRAKDEHGKWLFGKVRHDTEHVTDE